MMAVRPLPETVSLARRFCHDRRDAKQFAVQSVRSVQWWTGRGGPEEIGLPAKVSENTALPSEKLNGIGLSPQIYCWPCSSNADPASKNH